MMSESVWGGNQVGFRKGLGEKGRCQLVEAPERSLSGAWGLQEEDWDGGVGNVQTLWGRG